MATYAALNPAPSTWTQAPAATEDVLWFVRSGTVLLTTADTGSDNTAFPLVEGRGITIRSGVAVWYRAPSGGTPVHLVRNGV